MSLELDINSELYMLDINDRFTFALGASDFQFSACPRMRQPCSLFFSECHLIRHEHIITSNLFR